MPVFLLYLLKLSIGIALVYLFYRLLLQRLTFYQANRWCLLIYPLLCCIIPFIDVSPLVSVDAVQTNTIVQYIPVVQQYVAPASSGAVAAYKGQSGWELINPWTMATLVVLAGMLFLLVRLLIRFASLMRIKKQAVLIDNDGVKLYKVQGNLLPFSFADSIYVNIDAYSPDELQKIIRHEQVHVNQKHTVDVMMGELFCIINWYNPFAWLLRHSIRQNLEFIADHSVVEHGTAKKDYQHLLLKVTGVPVFAIANQFNFSSLKKRIVMMNRIKSAPIHLVKFLFLLPLLAMMLLAFRDKAPSSKNIYYANGIVVDAVSLKPISGAAVKETFSGLSGITDKNGYYSIALPISDKRLERRFSFFKPGYHQMVDGRVMIYKTPPEKDGSLLFVGLSQNGKGGFAKEIDLPKKGNNLITHPDGAALQQLYETAKADLYGEREGQAMAETDSKPVTKLPLSTALQQIFAQSQQPYHYIDNIHYLVNEKGTVATVSGEVKQLMIEVAGVRYTGDALNKKFKKQQMGGCIIRMFDETVAAKQDADVIIMTTLKE